MGNLITRGPKNLLAWNEELDRNPPWTPTRLTVPSIVSPAPDGRNAASILHEDATAASSHLIGTTTLYEVNLRYTIFFYAAQINRNWIRLGRDNALSATVSVYAFFNLATGALGAGGASTYDYAEINDVGGGWYRCWLTWIEDATNAAALTRIVMGEADDDVIFDGLDQDSYYAWRPQVNYGWGPDESVLTREVALT